MAQGVDLYATYQYTSEQANNPQMDTHKRIVVGRPCLSSGSCSLRFADPSWHPT